MSTAHKMTTTSGAMRAADEITRAIANESLSYVQICDIIDRATGAPELLEACKLCAAYLSDIPAFGDDIGPKVSKAQLGMALRACRAAIAKAIGENPSVQSQG